MAKPIIRTWAHLYERLGRQDFRKLKNSRIEYRDKDGNIFYLRLIYNNTGSKWWFEEIKAEEIK